jgi:sarcosine oxidase
VYATLVAMTYDVIVVGLGALGSAAAYHLARRGQRVLGLEQFTPVHALGSSHGESRIIRLAYHEHPNYVALLRRAYTLWEALEREASGELLRITGGLFIGPEHGEVFAGALESARLHNLPHEVLSAADVRRRYSVFHPSDGDVAFYEPNAGVLFPERCITAHLRLAAAAGATLRYETAVTRITAKDGGVEVETAGETFHAARVVVTAGAWLGRLLASLRLSLEPERNVVFWFEPRSLPERFDSDRFPIFIWERGAEGTFYGLPHVGLPGVKVACHHTGEVVDPDRVRREVDAADEAPVRHFVERCIPDLAGSLAGSTVCLYTNTPDRHFVVDRHPEHPEVVFAGGCSGHGFKFASVLGEVLADLAITGAASARIDFLGINRFA